jgi:hypothetical protein
VDLNVNIFSSASTSAGSPDSSTGAAPALQTGPPVVACPNCEAEVATTEANAEWQTCASCEKRLLIRSWPTVRQNNNASAALADQATCFFHPDKTVQACCHRCGRFVCALCDLQLGAEHVCPTCFERGRGDGEGQSSQAEWRYRDVLYDSIALAIGWAWILFWPTFVVALPAAIFLHARYRKAPRSYLIPRSGWRFWMAYAGLTWIPILVAIALVPALLRRH